MKLQPFAVGAILPAFLTVCPFMAFAQSSPTILTETDPSIAYTGTWYQNYETPNYGGESFLTNDKGATAVVTFNGTGITWYGVEDPYSGLAQVYLDGVPSTVDNYAQATLYQQPLFTAQGLTPGVHTLSIQVLHQRDGETQGSWVWINYFKIYNGSVVTGGVSADTGRAEPDSPSIVYNGNWYQNKNAAHSGGTAVLAMDVNSAATITFSGSQVQWIAYRDPWSGIAKVSIDGALVSTVDTYSATEQDQVVAFDSGALTTGSHTLSIQVTGTRDGTSGGAWVWLDSFVVK
jgi:hypothetical protein